MSLSCRTRFLLPLINLALCGAHQAPMPLSEVCESKLLGFSVAEQTCLETDILLKNQYLLEAQFVWSIIFYKTNFSEVYFVQNLVNLQLAKAAAAKQIVKHHKQKQVQ